ncbi:hypothetical protein K2173_027027 [Erythroxylum novogranatense]|uniref:BHLH domain-containing protein n=1 Tax=Erythroxylum novogranatense TaxID=1862640 RepID=A0AAV8TXZ5_9ROSI|nr:hypothetical protein K2173_027027 [Erythroxylum novogranatense]
MKKLNSTHDRQSSKLDRKTVERNRRIHMKGLCFKLASLIPPSHFKTTNKDMLSQQDQLDHAASYIKQQRERINQLKRIKEQAMISSPTGTESGTMDGVMVGLRVLPVVELKDLGSSIEVVLISGLNKNFMLYEAISILQEEGAEVVSASFSSVGDKVFHTLHAKVKISRVGVETTRVCERLRELVCY